MGRRTLPERVLGQILLGVSTRNDETSLEPLPEQFDEHGAEKSSASRHLVASTRKMLEEDLSRSLSDVELDPSIRYATPHKRSRWAPNRSASHSGVDIATSPRPPTVMTVTNETSPM